MSNIFYQGAVLTVPSGVGGATTYVPSNVQNIGINYSIPRQNVNALGKFKPNYARPVINYTPCQLSVDFLKGDSFFESAIGLTNPTGVAVLLFGPASGYNSTSFDTRNYTIYLSPTSSPNYEGSFLVQAAAIQSYQLATSVGEPARVSMAFEGLDSSYAYSTTAKNTIASREAAIVKPEGIKMSGINFSGLGFSGVLTQSVNLSFQLNRASTFRLGNKFPERTITEIQGSLQINGFIENISDVGITGFGQFDCGYPLTGSVYITLFPSCSSNGITYEIVNPYFDSMNFGVQVGNFASAELGFSFPISVLPTEALSGSNLIIR